VAARSVSSTSPRLSLTDSADSQSLLTVRERMPRWRIRLQRTLQQKVSSFLSRSNPFLLAQLLALSFLLARKAEAARLLAEEEASLPSKPKAAPSKTKKPAVVKSTPSIPSFTTSDPSDPNAKPESFSASGIDDALDMLNLVGARTDKAALGSQAAKVGHRLCVQPRLTHD